MRIFVDENIPKVTVEYLNNSGHEVLDLRNTPKEGLNDEKVWALVLRQRRMLITTDKGFLTHRQEKHYGVLVILLRKPNTRKIHEKVVQALRLFQEKDWLGMAVVMRDRVMTMWKRKGGEQE